VNTVEIVIRADWSKRKILREFAKLENFPSYFSYNWDSLFSCMLDFVEDSESTLVVYFVDFSKDANDDVLFVHKLCLDAAHEANTVKVCEIDADSV